MKITKELRTMSEADLKKRREELKKEVLKYNGQRASGTNPENVGKLRQSRKNIARINTLLRQKQKELLE